MILKKADAAAFLAAVALGAERPYVTQLSMVIVDDSESHVEARYGLNDGNDVEVRRYPHGEGREAVERYDDPAAMVAAYEGAE